MRERGARGRGEAARGCATLYVAEAAQLYCVRVEVTLLYVSRRPYAKACADLHLGDDGEGGGVDVGEGEEAEQVPVSNK